MGKKHERTLKAIFRHPTASKIKWADALALLVESGAKLEEREGSRMAVYLNEDIHTMHRPHPGNEIDKGAVASLRKFLDRQGIKP
jgi:hypothetical protein